MIKTFEETKSVELKSGIGIKLISEQRTVAIVENPQMYHDVKISFVIAEI